MKKIALIVLIFLLICGAFAAWIVLGPATGFEAPAKFLYIRPEAATKQAVMDSLVKNNIITNETAFEFLANRMDYWKNIKPGRYQIKKNTSLLAIVRKLRNGQQDDVDLVIIKLRTKEDLARLVGRKFACDSLRMINFLNNTDSLTPYNIDPEAVMAQIIPDTYTYYWNASPAEIYQKLYEASQEFWTDERRQKAAALGLTPLQAYTLSSIVEEETTNNNEKDTIASVYLNRLRIGMPLQADPTLKFAVKDFALKRIAGKILDVESPFNTYKNKGLPPGPICTPTRRTIDEVLNPAQTDYLYFVANRKLSGHLFSVDYADHLKKRDVYLADDKARTEKESEKQKSSK